MSSHTVSVALGLHHLPFMRGMDGVLRQTSAASRMMEKLDRRIRNLGQAGPEAPFLRNASRAHTQVDRIARQQERLRTRAMTSTAEYNELQRRATTATAAHEAAQLSRQARLAELTADHTLAQRSKQRIEEAGARQAMRIATAREEADKKFAEASLSRRTRLDQLKRRQQIIDRSISVQRMRHEARTSKMQPGSEALRIEREAMHARELRAADATARVKEATSRTERQLEAATRARASTLQQLAASEATGLARRSAALERNEKRFRSIERERADIQSKLARSADAHGARRTHWLEREALLTERLNRLEQERIALQATHARAAEEASRLDRVARSSARIARAERVGRVAGKVAIGAGIGLGILGAAGKSLWKPGTDLIGRENFLRMAGVNEKDLEKTRTRIAELQKSVPSVSTVRALEIFGETRGLFGADKALEFMPLAMRTEALANVIGGPGFSFREAGKVFDILGSTADPQRTEKLITMMMKSYLVSEGQVRPETFQQVLKYARGAKFGLSDEFLFQILPGLMMQYMSRGGGGGGRGNVGTMLADFARPTVQGTVPKQLRPILADYGLYDPEIIKKYGKADIPALTPLIHSDLASENPFAWTTTVLIPAIEKYIDSKGGETFRGKHYSLKELQQPENQLAYRNIVARHIQHVIPTRLAQAIMQDFGLTADEIERDVALMSLAFKEMGDSLGSVYDWVMKNDPRAKTAAVVGEFETVRQSLGKLIVPLLVPYLEALSGKLRGLNDTIAQDPEKVQTTLDNTILLAKVLAGLTVTGATVWGLSKVYAIGEGLIAITTIGGLAGLGATLSAVAVGLVAVAAAAGLILLATDKETRDSAASRAGFGLTMAGKRASVAAANAALTWHHTKGVFGQDEEWKATESKLRDAVTLARLDEAMTSFEYYNGFQAPQSGGPRELMDPATALFANATKPQDQGTVVNNFVEVRIGEETIESRIERTWQELERSQTGSPNLFNLGRAPQVSGPSR